MADNKMRAWDRVREVAGVLANRQDGKSIIAFRFRKDEAPSEASLLSAISEV